jgi:hypothetical protein
MTEGEVNLSTRGPTFALWVLFVTYVVITGWTLVFGLYLKRRDAVSANKDLVLQSKEDRLRARIENETDIEQLRTTALKVLQMSHNDWRAVVSISRQATRIVLWYTIIPAITAGLLGAVLYDIYQRRGVP